MGIFSSLFKKNNIKVTRDKLGNFSYEINESAFGNEKDYLNWSLTNPVLMTVIAIRSKLYSQMQITHCDSKGEPIENSDVLKLLKNPNYFQSQQDFLFQQMWYLSATGENYTYSPRRFKTELPTKLYNLIPSEIDFDKAQELNKFLLNDSDNKKFGERQIEYTIGDETIKVKLADLIPFYDLANNIQADSWFSSPSRVKGVEKVLQNLEENIKSKNVNLKMSQKYLASNRTSPEGTPQIQQADREDIEAKVGRNSLLVTNANVDVKHLVSDMKRLYLDEQFSNDALSVLLAFEMNKDVLNYSASSGSTYENQEQGIIRFVQNSIQSSADNTMNSFSEAFGLFEKGETLKASFNHLPVMQSVMLTKIETFKAFQESIKIGVEMQTITVEEAKEMSDKLKLDLGL